MTNVPSDGGKGVVVAPGALVAVSSTGLVAVGVAGSVPVDVGMGVEVGCNGVKFVLVTVGVDPEAVFWVVAVVVREGVVVAVVCVDWIVLVTVASWVGVGEGPRVGNVCHSSPAQAIFAGINPTITVIKIARIITFLEFLSITSFPLEGPLAFDYNRDRFKNNHHIQPEGMVRDIIQLQIQTCVKIQISTAMNLHRSSHARFSE